MKPILATVLLSERFFAPKEWKLEIPAMPFEDAAAKIFHISNAPDGVLSEAERKILEQFPRTGLRSVSVGDVIILRYPPGTLDGNLCQVTHILSVASCGFTAH